MPEVFIVCCVKYSLLHLNRSMLCYVCFSSITSTQKMDLNHFRCIAVLGRGHFGKVIISSVVWMSCRSSDTCVS